MEEATIYSFTEIFNSAEAFQMRTPYISGILEKKDGKRFPAFIEYEGMDISIGKTVVYSHSDENDKPVYKSQ